MSPEMYERIVYQERPEQEVQLVPEVAEGAVQRMVDALTDVTGEFGMPPERVPDVFNLWMNVEYTADMGIEIKEAQCQKGDYIDFLAHMDCLIALSACPGTEKSVSMINGDVNKPLKAEIWQQSA